MLVAAAGACGDDDNGGVADAGVDAPDGVDAAPPPSFTLTALMGEVSIDEIPQAGDGLLHSTVFVPSALELAYQQDPDSPFGCDVFEGAPEEFAAASQGIDVGTVEWSIPDGPPIPPCNYVEGRGYLCVGASGSGGDIGVVDAPNGIYSLTDTGVTFGTDQVGRHLEIAGATTPTNNGVFPIVGADGDNTVLFLNQAPGEEELATSASYQTVVGLGPSGMDNPMQNDIAVEFSLTANEDAPIESFTATVVVPRAFTLDTASQGMLSNIPLDGLAFTVGCQGEGGDCGTALAASVLQIVTTDGDVTGLPPNVMPPPETKGLIALCIVPSGSVTFPAEASAILEASGATRVQAAYARALPGMNLNRPWLGLFSPHMKAGITTP
jgi:hypothetical protein